MRAPSALETVVRTITAHATANCGVMPSQVTVTPAAYLELLGAVGLPANERITNLKIRGVPVAPDPLCPPDTCLTT